MSMDLSFWAWMARDHAQLYRGETKVGVAIQAQVYGEVYSGCNIEMPFNHGMHAEVNAIGSMIRINPLARVKRILIAADRPLFTPCGACMDWLMHFGDDDTIVIHEREPGVKTFEAIAGELMPHYPR